MGSDAKHAVHVSVMTGTGFFCLVAGKTRSSLEYDATYDG